MFVSIRSTLLCFAFVSLLFTLPTHTPAQTTTRISVGVGGVESNQDSIEPRISADGRFVVFRSFANNLVAGDTNNRADIFVTELATNITRRVNVSTSGTEANNTTLGYAISGDGRYITFDSIATNLVAGDTNATYDVFVRDTIANTTTRITSGIGGAQTNGLSVNPVISRDGRYIAYESTATNLVVGDTNGQRDIFLYDTTTATTTLLSVSSSGQQATSGSQDAAISGDGSTVAFYSNATNLIAGDTNAAGDVFVRNIAAGTTILASVATDGTQGNAPSGFEGISLSNDGKVIAFDSDATNLVPMDVNSRLDVFVRDLTVPTTPTTTRVSIRTGGLQGNDDSFLDKITPDGKYILFDSYASSLIVGDTNGAVDVFIHERATGATYRVSLGEGGVEGNDETSLADISADASVLVFTGYATNLVPNDTNGFVDVFARAPLNLPVTLSGTLTLQGIAPSAPNQTLTFTFRTDGVDTVKTVSVGPSGAFDIAGLPRATYDILISGGSYLSKRISVDLSAGNVTLPNPILLKTGDATRDNAVDITDLSRLIRAYNQPSSSLSYDEGVDFNLDQVNDIGDLLLLVGNYNAIGDILP